MGKSKKAERVNGEVEKAEKPAETVAADASGELKSKKRKRTEAAAENEIVKEVAETNGATEEKPKKKSKKSKGEKGEEEKKKKETTAAAEEPAEAPKKEKKEKKEKKDKKDKKDKKKSKDGAAAGGEPETSQPNDGEPMTVAVPEEHDEEAVGNTDESQKAGKSRWIVFIGNLPFSASTTSVSAHFASLKPIGVRLLTDKNTGKSRGIAFVEFDNYDRMKTCLEKYHHTEFNDGISPARKINVELTAGGGGKTNHRKDKIKEKNQKLNEERANRLKREEAAKLERQKEAEQKAQKTVEQKEEDDIHPSRRGRVPFGNKKW